MGHVEKDGFMFCVSFPRRRESSVLKAFLDPAVKPRDDDGVWRKLCQIIDSYKESCNRVT